MQKITIATFDDPAAAEMLKQRFVQQGLPAELHDDRKLQRLWFLSRPHAFIQVKVANENFERAEEIYRALDLANDTVVCAAIRCPQCRSSRIQYPQMTRHFILPTLVAHLATLLGLKRNYYCQRCQHTWENKEIPMSDVQHWQAPDGAAPGRTSPPQSPR